MRWMNDIKVGGYKSFIINIVILFEAAGENVLTEYLACAGQKS